MIIVKITSFWKFVIVFYVVDIFYGLAQQSCNEDSSKILGEGRWYWIHDFGATFGVTTGQFTLHWVAK